MYIMLRSCGCGCFQLDSLSDDVMKAGVEAHIKVCYSVPVFNCIRARIRLMQRQGGAGSQRDNGGIKIVCSALANMKKLN